MSGTVSDLLTQVLTAHNSTTNDLQSEVVRLKEKIKELEKIILRFPNCAKCGSYLDSKTNDMTSPKITSENNSPQKKLRRNENEDLKNDKTITLDLDKTRRNNEENHCEEKISQDTNLDETELDILESSVHKITQNTTKTVNTNNSTSPEMFRSPSPLFSNAEWLISKKNTLVRGKCNNNSFISCHKKPKDKYRQVTVDTSFRFAVCSRKQEVVNCSNYRELKTLNDENAIIDEPQIIAEPKNISQSSPSLLNFPEVKEREMYYNGSLDPSVIMSSEDDDDQPTEIKRKMIKPALIVTDVEEKKSSEKKVEPNYKYRSDVVRRQDERKKLIGHPCRECNNYYDGLPISKDEAQERLKKCSRHRDKFVPPQTPENFWCIDFPTTQECKEQGVINTTQYRPLQARRKRLRD